jgi:hypothetical protein
MKYTKDEMETMYANGYNKGMQQAVSDMFKMIVLCVVVVLVVIIIHFI